MSEMSDSDVERLLFREIQDRAIARLFGNDRGGVFMTEQYAESMSVVCSLHRSGRLKRKMRRPSLDIARSQLAFCEHVILIGSDLWLTSDSRENGTQPAPKENQ